MIQETQLSRTLECNAEPAGRRDCCSDEKRSLISKTETLPARQLAGPRALFFVQQRETDSLVETSGVSLSAWAICSMMTEEGYTKRNH